MKNRENLTWSIKTFDELNTDELYNILALRIEVFMIEQNTQLSECDFTDKEAIHIFASDFSKKIVAYARILPPGIVYPTPGIGRVVIHQKYRSKGLGKILLQKTITKLEEIYGSSIIEISAQDHLRKFYENFGFRTPDESEVYLEAGIPHIRMLRKA